MAIASKKTRVTVDFDVSYKAKMSGLNAVVVEAIIGETFYPISVLPEASREAILSHICETVRIEQFEQDTAVQELGNRFEEMTK